MSTAVQLAYQRGYNAGKRRLVATISRENLVIRQNAFWQRAYIAALTAFIPASGWVQGKRQFTNLPDKIDLAKQAADEALRVAISEGRL